MSKARMRGICVQWCW